MKKELIKQKGLLQQTMLSIKHAKSLINIPYSVIDSVPKDSKIWVLGAGKASVEMASQLQRLFGNRLVDGIIIAPHVPEKSHFNFQAFGGAHPIPDENSVAASLEMVQLAKSIPKGDVVFFCLSGGASSLFCVPPEHIELKDVQILTHLLLESGMPIHHMNIVRKHISEVKGGRLSRMLHKNPLHTLILSDVTDDDIETIGSAPTVHDSSSYDHAVEILQSYKVWDKLPQQLKTHFEMGIDGTFNESPKPGVLEHPNHKITLLNGVDALLQQVAEPFKEAGYTVIYEKNIFVGDVREVSKKICSEAVQVLSGKGKLKKPAVLIYRGESTVKVKGNGKGGRCQELALIAALSTEGQHAISMLCMGTDGIDGPTDAAGAIITSETTLKARKMKLQPEEFLQQNNSYTFHETMQTLIKTGPTGNNMMDVIVAVVG